jgi:hypothetical protein
MFEDEYAALEKLREFERTFAERYRRCLTDEEESTLRTAEKILRERISTHTPLGD